MEIRSNNRRNRTDIAVAEYLRRLDDSVREYDAIYIRVSALENKNLRESHRQELADTFAAFVSQSMARYFWFANEDVIVIYNRRIKDEILSCLVKIRFIFHDDQLLKGSDNLESAGFIRFYNMAQDKKDFYHLVSFLSKQQTPIKLQTKKVTPFTMSPINQTPQKQKKPLTTDILARVQKILSVADFSSFIRRQAICAVIGKSSPLRVFEEVYVSIPDLREMLLPDVDLLSDPWLFLSLSETLDKRVLETISRHDDGSLIGIFTTDYFPRDSKRGGAWMNNVRQQYVDADGNDVRPIIVNVGNLSENMNIDEVQTVFHEFGHALHGLLSKCTYPSVSGTNVTRDFVEMFSQFNENWAFQPDLLAVYAKNSAGEVIPVELVHKILNSLKFNQGFMTTELCAAAILDMKWHELESVDGISVADFEKKVCDEMDLIPEIAPRYRTTYFNHIFSSGYAAGYYGYLWAEVLDKDAFSAFQNSPNGIWDLEMSKRFRQIFLEKGGSEEPMVLYKEFMGREPDSRAMLLGRGLIEDAR